MQYLGIRRKTTLKPTWLHQIERRTCWAVSTRAAIWLINKTQCNEQSDGLHPLCAERTDYQKQILIFICDLYTSIKFLLDHLTLKHIKLKKNTEILCLHLDCFCIFIHSFSCISTLLREAQHSSRKSPICRHSPQVSPTSAALVACYGHSLVGYRETVDCEFPSLACWQPLL